MLDKFFNKLNDDAENKATEEKKRNSVNKNV